MDLNKTILIGRIATDLEVRSTTGGLQICSFSIAVSRYASGKNKTSFFKCTAFSKAADFISEYFKKGHKIALDGRLEQNSWEKDGKKFYSVEIVVEHAFFVESKNKSEQPPEQLSFDEIKKIENVFSDKEIPF